MLKGYPIEGRRRDLEQQDKDLILKHATFTQAGVNKYALDVMPQGVGEVASAVVVEAGSNSSDVIVTGHSVKKGDVIELVSTANTISEKYAGVLEVIDANTFRLAGDLSDDLIAGDTFNVLRPVFNRLAADGSTLATVTSPPVRIKRGNAGVFTDQFITKDSTTASNTIGMPVEIVSASGTDISITAGDIDIQTTHAGANPDSMQIGDGTETLDITADGEAETFDATTHTKLDEVSAQLPSVIGQNLKADSLSIALASDHEAIDVSNISGTVSLPTGASTEAKQDATITAVQAVETDVEAGNALLTNIEAKDFATQTTLAAINTKTPSLGQKLDAGSVPVTLSTSQDSHLEDIDTATTALANEIAPTGGLDVNVADIGTLATEATVSSIDGKLPAALGQKTAAASLAVTLPSDQAALPVERETVTDFDRVDFTATSVTDTAYIAFNTDSGATPFTRARFFYAGGDPLFLAIGATAAETNIMMIPPGADFEIGLDIPANSRISLKAVVAGTTVSTGQLIINWMA